MHQRQRDAISASLGRSERRKEILSVRPLLEDGPLQVEPEASHDLDAREALGRVLRILRKNFQE